MSEQQKQDLSGVTLLGNQNTKYEFDYNPGLLEKFKIAFDTSDEEQVINLDCFEFQSKCPKTGQPDFATIHISYIPNEYAVESKSLKLFLFSFQQKGSFHESCIHTIMDDLVKLLEPRLMVVYGDFNSRGGISITPLSIYADENHQEVKKALQLQCMIENMKHRPRNGQ